MVAHAASHSVQGAEAEAGRAPLGLQRAFQASWGSVLRPSLKKKMKTLRRGREWRATCGDRRKGGKRNRKVKKLRNVS